MTSRMQNGQGTCCFVDVGGHRAASATELSALLARLQSADAPAAPANATPALHSFDHVAGRGGAAAGGGGPALTAVLYGSPASVCFLEMYEALAAAAEAGASTPGPYTHATLIPTLSHMPECQVLTHMLVYGSCTAHG